MSQPASDYGQCLERHRPYLYMLARIQLRRRQMAKLDASDIVQQTLFDACANREQFRGGSDAELAAWLRQILKHNLLDAVRHQHREKRDIRRELSLEAAIDDSLSRTHAGLVAFQSSPSQKVVRQEDVMRLSQALSELPDAQREAIILHHLQGMKLAEVAAELGRSEAAVAGLLFRGLKSLNELVNQ